MATRFRLPSAGTPPISPAFDAGWENTGSAIRRNLPQTPSGSTFASFTITEAVSNTAYDMLHAQFISVPLDAQTISGTVKGVVRVSENFASPDFEPQIKIYVVDNAGTTVRGTLLDFDTNNVADANEYATTLTNRYFPRGGSAALSSLAVSAGDRIVVEIGTRKTNITNSSRVSTIDFGDNAGSDLSDDQTNTVRNNPWIEFSQTLVFQGVSKSLSPSYNILPGVTSVSKTLSPSYKVRKQVSQTRAVSYAVRKQIAQTRAVSYTVRKTIPKSLSASYSVRKQISKSRSVSYTLRNQVLKARTENYIIRNRVQALRGVSYSVRALVSKSQPFAYNIRRSVSKSQTMNYVLRAIVSQSLGVNYQVISESVPAGWFPMLFSAGYGTDLYSPLVPDVPVILDAELS